MKKSYILLGILIFSLLLCACQNKDSEYDWYKKEGIIIEESDEILEVFTPFYPNGASSLVASCPIRLVYTNQEITYDCSVDESYIGGLNPQKTCTYKYNSYIYWHESNKDTQLIDYDYINIVLKDNDNIIGFAVVVIKHIGNYVYSSSILKSVIFPKVDGKYQNITSEQINRFIDECKDKNK